MPVSEQTYERLALEDPEHHWELHDGLLREKPPMSFDHGDVIFFLGHLLQLQLDRLQYRIYIDHAYLRRSNEKVYIPDLVVIPMALAEPLRGRRDLLDLYSDPLPLVVEVWSPSTG